MIILLYAQIKLVLTELTDISLPSFWQALFELQTDFQLIVIRSVT